MFVRVGLPQILESEAKDCIKVYLGTSINLGFGYYLFIYLFFILKFLLDYVDFKFFFFWLIVMFCLHALVVNTIEKMFG